MLRIEKSAGEVEIKLFELKLFDDGTKGCTERFYIDTDRRLKFIIFAKPKGVYLKSLSNGIVHLRFYLWLKNKETGQTEGDKIPLTRTFHLGDNYGHGIDEGGLEKFAKDGVLTVGYRIENAQIMIRQETTICWPKPELYDCVVSVGDRKFPASKYVMGVQSDVFAALWKADMVEGKTNELKIEDFDAAIVEHMLSFLHSFGSDLIHDEDVDELYRIADKYQLFILMEKCVETMVAKLSKETLPKFVIVAFQYSIPELMNLAIGLVRCEDKTNEKHASSYELQKTLLHSPVFSKLGEEDFGLFMEILQTLWA